MLQILPKHFLRHLAYRGTEVSSCPEMPTPILFLHVRKFFKQLTRCALLDPPHDLTRCHCRRATHQLSNSLRYLCAQYFVSVFRNPYNVVLNLIHRMTATVIIHAAPPFVQHILAAKTGGLNLMMDNETDQCGVFAQCLARRLFFTSGHQHIYHNAQGDGGNGQEAAFAF